MSTETKKPPSSGSGRPIDINNSSLSASSAQPRSMPSPTTSGTTSGTTSSSPNSSPARRMSTRGGTAASVRASVHRPSPSTSIHSLSSAADETARAETVALIDDLKDRLHKADVASEQYRKQSEVLQSRFDEALKEQAKLEERVHEGEEQMETLRNDKRESARQMREMETIYEAERSAMLKEKEEMSNREEEMQSVINRLKESLNQRSADEENRPTRKASVSSPGLESGNFAPPSSLSRSDSRNNSKLLLQKDKLIESLRLELAEAQIKLVESENQGGGRLHEVERLLVETRMANARLMEDNESYQLLLQEKTLHGDFGKGDFSYMSAAANQDALNALEGRPSSRDGDAPRGASLADELGHPDEGVEESVASQADLPENQRRLEAELRAAKDQNKALTLYINKIIERLLQHQDFESILESSDAKPNVNKDLPPAPSDKPGGLSLVQRAKTMVGGSAPPTGRIRPRPMSFMPSSTNTAHNDPETAPSIPIGPGRSTSSRRGGRPMSDQFYGAASVVNAMYKGPQGAISPTLSSPRHSAHYTHGHMPRHSSASGVTSVGNFPGMRSETSSVSGDSVAEGTASSQSPPRAGSTYGGDKGGAKFEGNKPRPLRLVQEAAEGRQVHQKRASWIGWAQAAWKKDDAVPAQSIQE